MRCGKTGRIHLNLFSLFCCLTCIVNDLVCFECFQMGSNTSFSFTICFISLFRWQSIRLIPAIWNEKICAVFCNMQPTVYKTHKHKLDPMSGCTTFFSSLLAPFSDPRIPTHNSAMNAHHLIPLCLFIFKSTIPSR